MQNDMYINYMETTEHVATINYEHKFHFSSVVENGYSYLYNKNYFKKIIVSKEFLEKDQVYRIFDMIDDDIFLEKKDAHTDEENIINGSIKNKIKDKMLSLPIHKNVEWELIYNLSKNYKLNNNILSLCNEITYLFLCAKNIKDSEITRRKIYFFQNLDDFMNWERKDIVDYIVRDKNKSDENGICNFVFLNTSAPLLVHEVFGHPLEINTSPSFAIGDTISTIPTNIYSKSLKLVKTHNYDDFGDCIKELKLIDNSRILKMMTDIRFSKFEKQERSGNSRRNNYKDYPQSRMYGISLEKGDSCIDDIIKSTDEGILVNELFDGRIDRDNVVHLIGLSKHKISKGRLIFDPKIIKIEDDLKEIIKNIESISNRSHILPIYCNKSSGRLFTESESPDIKISNLKLKKVWKI